MSKKTRSRNSLRASIKRDVLHAQPKLRNFRIRDLKRYARRNLSFRLPFNPRIRRLKKYHGYKVFLVDGTRIRRELDIDFVMGGNGMRYLYVPLGEIWIDGAYRGKGELRNILLHEYVETGLMKKGLSYYAAHDIASMKELELRRG